MGNGAPSAVAWVAGVFVLGYTAAETLGVESLASICKMWVIENDPALAGRRRTFRVQNESHPYDLEEVKERCAG